MNFHCYCYCYCCCWYWHNEVEMHDHRSFFIDQIAIERNGYSAIWNMNWKWKKKMPTDNWNDCADIYTNLHTYALTHSQSGQYRHIWLIGKREWTLNKQQMIWMDRRMDGRINGRTKWRNKLDHQPTITAQVYITNEVFGIY